MTRMPVYSAASGAVPAQLAGYWTATRGVAVLLALLALAGCRIPPPYQPPPQPTPVPSTPAPQPTPQPEPEVEPEPEPPQPPPKQFRLGAASTALVQQARTQAKGGNGPAAVATIERALRIEPGNPLLWLELGEINQAEGRYAQAHSMGRKALQLGAGDPRVQSSAWKLIADSLRARGRNQEAAEAEQRASTMAPR